MKQFITFVRKEFAHVLRDRKTLLILFGMPVMQILIFGFALTNEVKNSAIVVVDYAQDEASQKLISRIEASRYFEVSKSAADHNQIEESFKEGKVKLALIFPQNFYSDLMHQNKAQIQIITDATDPNTANTLANYVTAIIQDYQADLNQNASLPYRIIPETKMLYNPQLKSVHGFVPGVMALVLMLVCVMMTAVSIVREKEMGTMEILLVSPFKPLLVILSKAVPYLILSLINVASILCLSVFVLDLPVNGSLLLLFAESTLFIITCLTIGIFISVRTASQQVAMLISLMGMMLPTILFSGFMFPIENMPKVLQVITNIVPAKWYYIIVKSIMIKGLGFSAIWKETLILAGMTLFLLIVSLKNFKIRLA
ncbi:MAG TPA: ABC transporter permease [Cyclobacteriaceae bacterium]|nr:ABC transporter permease [Cyclobacteriaceae bacterium]HMV08840.1 ABC transporter permease [Cyclobacteriaceae bacterium]HMV91201.1 ABC transporter permease [Cyclobacteriaceae bacterium]HMW99986.1 ABC transporter permease [Cyclobacteriaceae bacterium]HMX49151.1 ABC transporter permease [Cyclobacteriaceae bacterium]